MDHIDPQQSVVVLLGLHLVVTVGKFVFELVKKKSEGTDKSVTALDLALTQNTRVLDELKVQLAMLKNELLIVGAMKTEMNNVFTALKEIAGPKKWAVISKLIQADKAMRSDLR